MKLAPIMAVIMASAAGSAAAQTAPQPAAPTLKIVENVKSAGSYKWRDWRKTDFSNTRFRNLDLAVDRIGFQIGGGVHNVVIEHSVISLRAPTTGGDLPSAVQITGSTATNITIRDSVFRDFRMVPVAGKYQNGDGFDCDARTAVVTLERVVAENNSDGGFDIKCVATLSDLTATANGRNSRFWGKISAGTLISRDPRKSHLWASKAMQGRIGTLVASGATGKPVFEIGEASLYPVAVERCFFDFAVPTKVFAGAKHKFELGPTCRPDANGYAVNTPKADFVAADELDDEDGDGKVRLINRAKEFGLKRGTVVVATPIAGQGFGYRILR